jgi:ABC-type nickel/cobalt efflux system permease component RcnA
VIRPYADPTGVAAYFIFLLLLTQDAVKGWLRKVSSVIIVALSLLNVYGTLQNLSEGDAQPNDLAHSLSTYIPHHTLIDENQTDEDSITY